MNDDRVGGPANVPAAAVSAVGHASFKSASRRHAGILPGPTHGHQANVWGYLFELLVEESFVVLSSDWQQLRAFDAERFADRAIQLTSTIHEAFRHLVRNGLVAIEKTDSDHFIGSVDLGELRQLLQRELKVEASGKRDTKDIPALHYFCARKLYARLPWLDRILEEAARAE
ncbi:MAG TPA: hypothetical protein VFZ65_04720 [Planctomycetota bacterium]|nr:hypothetical protein [Planctomycetota bacterium]